MDVTHAIAWYIHSNQIQFRLCCDMVVFSSGRKGRNENMCFCLTDEMFLFKFSQINSKWNVTFIVGWWHTLTSLNKWYLRHGSFFVTISTLLNSNSNTSRFGCFYANIVLIVRLHYVVRSWLLLNEKRCARAAKLKAEQTKSDNNFCSKAEQKKVLNDSI